MSRDTFAMVIEQSISQQGLDFEEIKDLLSLNELPVIHNNDGGIAHLLLAGKYRFVFQAAHARLPVSNEIDEQYVKMTQYFAKLALFKELCGRATTDQEKETCKEMAKSLYDQKTIQEAFKNISVDEVLQTLGLLKRIHNNYEWLGNTKDGLPLRQIGREILSIACDNPTFYQQRPMIIVDLEDVPKQLSNLFDFIKKDTFFLTIPSQQRAFYKKIIKGTQTEYKKIKDSGNHHQDGRVLLSGILINWEKSQDYLTDNDIYWLKCTPENFTKRDRAEVFCFLLAIISIGGAKYFLDSHFEEKLASLDLIEDYNKLAYEALENKDSHGFNNYKDKIMELFSYLVPGQPLDTGKLREHLFAEQQNVNTSALIGALAVLAVFISYRLTHPPISLPEWVNKWTGKSSNSSSESDSMGHMSRRNMGPG